MMVEIMKRTMSVSGRFIGIKEYKRSSGIYVDVE